MLCRGDGRQCVELIVDTAQSPIHMRYFLAMLNELEITGTAIRTEVTHGSAESPDFTPTALIQHTGQTFFQPIHHQAALPWHGSNQMVKLFLDGLEVLKNVGVIKLEVVQDGGSRSVMNKLAAFVKKCGVVLIRFDDEVVLHMARRNFAQACGHTKVQGNTAHQETRFEASSFQDPSQHGGGGGFAMGACHRQHMTALKHMFGQPLGPAGIRRAGFQDGFHEGEFGLARGQAASTDHIANDKQIGLEFHLIDAKAFNQLDAQSF